MKMSLDIDFVRCYNPSNNSFCTNCSKLWRLRPYILSTKLLFAVRIILILLQGVNIYED